MSVIGHNAPASISTTDDALGVAAAIAAMRTEIEANEKAWADEMAPLTSELKEMRAQRDEENKPHAERMEALRKMLADWLQNDPDMKLVDPNGAVVATLSRKAGAPKVDAAKLSTAYMTMQPNMSAINAALARGEHIEGVTIPVTTILRVL